VTGVIRADGVIERRLAGYRRALQRRASPTIARRVLSGSVTFDWGAEAAEQLVALPGATAAFCTADLIAAGVLAGLHRLGRRIPEDYSVMGFDNLSVSRMVYPALTTVDQSILQQGQARRQPHRGHPRQEEPGQGDPHRGHHRRTRQRRAEELNMGAVADRSKYVALAILLLPSLFGMFTFLMLPVIASFVLSFTEWDMIGELSWIGFDNYVAALADPAVLTALRNTLSFHPRLPALRSSASPSGWLCCY
jgi:hypothetical protein